MAGRKRPAYGNFGERGVLIRRGFGSAHEKSRSEVDRLAGEKLVDVVT